MLFDKLHKIRKLALNLGCARIIAFNINHTQLWLLDEESVLVLPLLKLPDGSSCNLFLAGKNSG